MKYIFVTGAPGSKWSSVVKNIYYSDSIDQTDYSAARTYSHDAPGEMTLMHLGAYFDPGMEFGRFFHRLNEFDFKKYTISPAGYILASLFFNKTTIQNKTIRDSYIDILENQTDPEAKLKIDNFQQQLNH